MAIGRFYKEFRRSYTVYYTRKRLESTKDFLEKNGIVRGGVIIDLGARVGTFNRILRELNFNKIVAVDIDSKALELNDADEKFQLNLEERIPFPSNYYDCVYAAEIIEHLDHREEFIREIHRILKPSGHLMMTTPNRKSLIAYFDRIIGRFTVNGHWNGHDFTHKYVYGFAEIRDLLEGLGFVIQAMETFYLFYGLPIRTKSSLGMVTWIIANKNS